MKTVRRNTKRFAAIFAQATSAACFTLGNNFSGEEIELDYIHEKMVDEVFKYDAKVVDYGEGKFRVRFHSNHWVNVTSPA